MAETSNLPKGKLAIWLMEIRAPFLTASIIPVILGTAIAWAVSGAFNAFYFVLALIGGMFLHIGTNVANDYYDHISGDDEANREFVRPFTGGSRTIQLGLLTPREVLTGALVSFAIGSAIGLYLAWQVGYIIIVIGIVGVISGFFYTAPPINLASRGIGELFVGLNFGVLMTLGAFYVQTAMLSWEPALAAVPISLLIAAVLYINQFQDCEADRSVGKRHLVVRLGKKKAVPGYAALMFASYIFVASCVPLGLISPFSLLIFLSLPLAVQGVSHAREYYAGSMHLAPANAVTVMSHLMIGILMTAGYILDRLWVGVVLYPVLAIIVLGALVVFFNMGIMKQRKAIRALKNAG